MISPFWECNYCIHHKEYGRMDVCMKIEGKILPLSDIILKERKGVCPYVTLSDEVMEAAELMRKKGIIPDNRRGK